MATNCGNGSFAVGEICHPRCGKGLCMKNSVSGSEGTAIKNLMKAFLWQSGRIIAQRPVEIDSQ